MKFEGKITKKESGVFVANFANGDYIQFKEDTPQEIIDALVENIETAKIDDSITCYYRSKFNGMINCRLNHILRCIRQDYDDFFEKLENRLKKGGLYDKDGFLKERYCNVIHKLRKLSECEKIYQPFMVDDILKLLKVLNVKTLSGYECGKPFLQIEIQEKYYNNIKDYSNVNRLRKVICALEMIEKEANDNRNN